MSEKETIDEHNSLQNVQEENALNNQQTDSVKDSNDGPERPEDDKNGNKSVTNEDNKSSEADCKDKNEITDTWEDDQPKIWIGFDLSTQQLKSIAIDHNLEIVCEASVNFDADLPEYR